MIRKDKRKKKFFSLKRNAARIKKVQKIIKSVSRYRKTYMKGLKEIGRALRNHR